MASTRSVAVQQSQGRREHVDAFARPPRPPAVEGEHDQEAVLLASSPWPQRSLRARRRRGRSARCGPGGAVTDVSDEGVRGIARTTATSRRSREAKIQLGPQDAVARAVTLGLI